MSIKKLELLAPARNKDIGIAAIDCGADAVYIAGPSFGAREAAGNSLSEISELTRYAHRFGAKIYLTLNTILYDRELEPARKLIVGAYEAGCDAIILQDLGILKMELPPIELHASTQCNIRTADQARFLESLGFRRLILARELSLAQIREIRAAVACELESFVHGALCVSYSGQCYMSQYLAGRSANRGCCVQACRSRYDLTDAEGKVIARNRPLLSLKDLSLEDRIGDMAEAGIISFKIEGRLKNASYVKNIVRTYRSRLDRFLEEHPEEFRKASFGKIYGGFTPNSAATFSRGYTRYFIDGTRDKWNSSDMAKSIGEYIGKVDRILSSRKGETILEIEPAGKLKDPLSNGDGLCYIGDSGDAAGIRADVVAGRRITVREIRGIRPGTVLYRNFNKRFEDEMENDRPERKIPVQVGITAEAECRCRIRASAENGRTAEVSFTGEQAKNPGIALQNIQVQMGKKADIFLFSVTDVRGTDFPFVPLSVLNAQRRELAGQLLQETDSRKDYRLHVPFDDIDTGRICPPERKKYLNCANRLSREVYEQAGIVPDPAYELEPTAETELMRTKYCLRNELGICPRIRKGERPEPLFLLNNGKRMKVEFDCSKCEMSIKAMPHKGN